jgi:hypothetical protein
VVFIFASIMAKQVRLFVSFSVATTYWNFFCITFSKIPAPHWDKGEKANFPS